ncbi:hypothetical protein ACX27_07725 [Nostoc piscinale CENA21]|uniref:Uncharacterized protein n=1 Tax=Nostoc piscinale CENA21 TaxID=224013 RepID=A0A0M4SJI9_9NOSO|nr:hypothetical protein [Nostoc piscinale]ALF52772.1 hypothetical protein ACX27_07725 [Nostoc piscinale CENA21]
MAEKLTNQPLPNPISVLKSLLKSSQRVAEVPSVVATGVGNPPTQRQLLQAGKPVQRTGSTFRKI